MSTISPLSMSKYKSGPTKKVEEKPWFLIGIAYLAKVIYLLSDVQGDGGGWLPRPLHKGFSKFREDDLL